MPYCVRCGVELQKDCKTCPLCQTEVVLPGEQDFGEGASVFPDHMPRRMRQNLNLAPSRAVLFLVTFILVVPILVTFIIDFTANHAVTWSFYPMTSLALLWILIAYPALLRGHTVFQVLTVDIFALMFFLLSMDLYLGPFPEWSQYPLLSLSLLWFYLSAPLIFTWNHAAIVLGIWFLATSGFLYAIDKLTGGTDWFLTLGLPVLGLVALVSGLGLLLFRLIGKKPLLIAGIASLALALSLSVMDGLVNLYVSQYFSLTWSPVLSAVLVPTGFFLFLTHGNSDLRAFLAKKFHV